MNFGLLHPREQLVQIMDRIYRYGLTTTSGGNLSILDENGDLWITPAGVDTSRRLRKSRAVSIRVKSTITRISFG